jgi:hypothetical protein
MNGEELLASEELKRQLRAIKRKSAIGDEAADEGWFTSRRACRLVMKAVQREMNAVR